MTRLAVLFSLVTSSPAISDSERMAAQMDQPTVALTQSPDKTAPEDIYQDYTVLTTQIQSKRPQWQSQ
jgi:hypothetical protein